jgi:hypothetical protein
MNAPDRVFVDVDSHGIPTAVWRSGDVADCAEYIRADLCRSPTQAADAALERAAQVCDDFAVGYAAHKGIPGALADAARDIRALQSAPAPTALQAALELPEVKALVEAMEEIAEDPVVPQHVFPKGIDFKRIRDDWRKQAWDRVNKARAALTALKPDAKGGA